MLPHIPRFPRYGGLSLPLPASCSFAKLLRLGVFLTSVDQTAGKAANGWDGDSGHGRHTGGVSVRS